jgi:hypothetical protein
VSRNAGARRGHPALGQSDNTERLSIYYVATNPNQISAVDPRKNIGLIPRMAITLSVCRHAISSPISI